MKGKKIPSLKNNKGEIDKKNITAVTFFYLVSKPEYPEYLARL